jgi:hypothetical protein
MLMVGIGIANVAQLLLAALWLIAVLLGRAELVHHPAAFKLCACVLGFMLPTQAG